MNVRKTNLGRYENIKEDPEFKIVELGNWNLKYGGDPVLTKPIGNVILPNTKISMVFRHQEIIDLIRMYHKADIKSIKMIKEGKAGQEKYFETPFVTKLLGVLRIFEQEAKEVLAEKENVEESIKDIIKKELEEW